MAHPARLRLPALLPGVRSALQAIWLPALLPLVLLLLALCVPLPLYLLALAVFGLPYVIWEMRFLNYCVLALLPRTHGGVARSGRFMPRRMYLIACALAAALLLYFLLDYLSARKLYAVAAGMHAWLEWPVLLMACLGSPMARRNRTP